jgi:hypothetical protein
MMGGEPTRCDDSSVGFSLRTEAFPNRRLKPDGPKIVFIPVGQPLPRRLLSCPDRRLKPTLRSVAIAIVFLVGFYVQAARGEENRTPTVGMAGRIEQLVLPGSELTAKPLEGDRTPIVLRIEAVFPHGTAHRYDLEFYGLEPGKFDLADYLQRKDGSAGDEIPAIPVEVQGILGPGQVQPNSLSQKELPGMGGYQTLLIVGGVIWIFGLLALLYFGRKKRHSQSDRGDEKLSLADRLRPIVEQAQTGELTKTEQAELERLLIGFWRARLDLEGQDMSAAIAILRQHDEAGALLCELEKWLHSPTHDEGVDVAELLKPYENVSVDSVDQ